MMAKVSAGVLLVRATPSGPEFLLAHPGGPFFARKDAGSWTIPKGLVEDGEEPLAAARREFCEETGQPCPEGELASLGTMSSLSQISGALVIDDNDALTDLSGLTGTMQRVTGAVTITGNANLTSLGALSHAQQINSASITNNPKLGTCRAVEIDHCVPNSTVTISGNLNQTNCACWCGQ
jgi:hypothetical protein